MRDILDKCVHNASEMTKQVARCRMLIKKCESNASYRMNVDVELIKQINLKLESAAVDLLYLQEK